MHTVFRYPKFSETYKGCPQNFLALWDQNFSTEKRDTPFFIHIFFETKNFFKNSRISLRKFSALWDMKISTGNRDMPPLIHKFFSIPEIFRKTEGFLYKAFRFGHVRQKVRQNRDAPSYAWKFWKSFSEAPKCSPMKYFNTVRQKLRRKIVILPPPPPPLMQTFSIPEIFATVKDSPTKIFGTVRQKNFDRKSWKSLPPPPPLLSINFFATGRFLKHSTEGFTYQIYRHCETKNFRRKNVIHPPPSFIQFFSGPEVSETLKDSPTKFFGTVRQKNFDRKSWKSPPPLIHKLFRYRKISETQHRRVHLPNLSTLWDQKFSTEERDTPFFIHIFFETKNFFKNSRISLRKFSALWDMKISTGNRDMPPSYP